MDAKTIAARKADIIQRTGAWTAHDFQLAEGVYTLGNNNEWQKLQRVVQIVADWSRKPISELRILDLACLEGGYAIEFARHGAEVIGIEGRDDNLEKSQFGAEALGLSKLKFVQDDVRNLSKAKYGEFDVVLCLGILYHINAPDVFAFMEAIAETTRGIAIIDTYCGIDELKTYLYKGKQYAGREIREHRPAASEEERLADKWASIDNIVSVWISRSTMYNALTDFGFSSVYECHAPTDIEKPSDRYTFVAAKGTPVQLKGMPAVKPAMLDRLPEHHNPLPSHKQQPAAIRAEKLTNMVPYGVRQALKTIIGRR